MIIYQTSVLSWRCTKIKQPIHWYVYIYIYKWRPEERGRGDVYFTGDNAKSSITCQRPSFREISLDWDIWAILKQFLEMKAFQRNFREIWWWSVFGLFISFFFFNQNQAYDVLITSPGVHAQNLKEHFELAPSIFSSFLTFFDWFHR